MPYRDVYMLRHEAAVSTAITLLQLKTGPTRPALIQRISLTQRLLVTSVQVGIALVKKTVAATVTTAAIGTHLFKKTGAPDPTFALGTAATGVIGTAEGTDGEIIWKRGLNILDGLEVPLWKEEEQIYIPADSIVALKFLEAYASHTWLPELTIMEL